jgi:hypothetical protein
LLLLQTGQPDCSEAIFQNTSATICWIKVFKKYLFEENSTFQLIYERYSSYFIDIWIELRINEFVPWFPSSVSNSRPAGADTAPPLTTSGAHGRGRFNFGLPICHAGQTVQFWLQ